MKRLFSTLFCLAALSGAALAQRATPSFGRYPVRVERPRARSIDFKHSPGASGFRTRLSEGLRRGVNFAGHYVVVGWGCGTGCISGAIVDARDGRVYWPEQLHSMATGTVDGGYVDDPVAYKTNSRLFIINGIPGQRDDDAPGKPQGLYYYEWRGNRLHQVKFSRTEPR
jgi:hypothetical protein